MRNVTPTRATRKPCTPVNDCNTHYRCDNQGNHVCLPGWTGTNCDIKTDNGVADCDVYDGEFFFSVTVPLTIGTDFEYTC